MALVAGICNVSVAATVSGAEILPQGTAATVRIADPTAGALGTGQGAFTFGTSAAQCDIYCAGDFDLAANGGADSIDLDIYTGTDFKNLFGQTAAFRKLKAAFFGVVSGGDTAGVAVGGAAANANAMFFADQTDKWKIFPDGVPLVGSSPAGVTVDATHCNIMVENLGAVAVTVRVILAGTSA